MFTKKHRRRQAWQKHLCSRKKEQQDHRVVESLEQRRLLAFDLATAYVSETQPFQTLDGTLPEELTQSPQQITLRFTPNTVVDPSSLASGISIVRAGGMAYDATSGWTADGFEADGNSVQPDRLVVPGALLVDDLPNQNQVVIRFAEHLPDDLYRITLSSDVDAETGAITGLKTAGTTALPAGEAFSRDGENSFYFDVQVNTGSQVSAVVPQPITRNNLTLSHTSTWSDS